MRSTNGAKLNWNQVFYFAEIAAAGSLKVAADKLGLSSPTLSEHLSQLESDLDVKLFHRHRRGMELTEQGAKLYCHAKEMFTTAKRFIDAVSPLPLGDYRICIALTPEASHTSVYVLINEFARFHNNASLLVSCCDPEDLEHLLVDARLDFGITDRLIRRQDVVQASVISSEVGLFVSSKLSERPLSQLLEEFPLLTCEREGHINSIADRLLFKLGITQRRRISSHLPNLIVDLCCRGGGVALLPQVYFEGRAGVQALPLPLDIVPPAENFYVTWLADNVNTVVIRQLKALLASKQRALQPKVS